MGRKRKSAAPSKRSSPAKVAKEDDDPQEEDEQQESTELAVVEEPESDPLATKPGKDGGDDSEATAAGGSGWEDKCRQWVVDQEEPESAGPEPLPDHDHDELAQLNMNALSRPLRCQLKDLTQRQIMHSVMFECEWERCEFECNVDLEYSTHVEEHVQRYLEGADELEGLVCYWDLCDFRTTSATELESHVHFHVYHNRIKTYGASLDACIDIPKCNNDSRRRNCIDMFKTSFRCEWGRCEERFNKVVPFFQHVNDHVRDQFPVDRKSTKEMLTCEWTHCTQQYFRRSVALEHIRRHSTERTIGCFNCGAIFTSRLKYIEHCRRQVDYHLREIPCPDCDKLFATPQLMEDHRAVHKRRHECPQCPMKWPSKKALACHIRYRHVSEKPFQCHLCDHRSVSIYDLESHMVRHKPKTVYECPWTDCPKKSKYEKTIQKHIHKKHLGFPMMVYACHLCDMNAESAAALSKHLVNAHRLKREPGYNRFAYCQDTATDGKYRLESFLRSRPRVAAASKSTNGELKLKTEEKEIVPRVERSLELPSRPMPMVSDISNLERYLRPKQEEWDEFVGGDIKKRVAGRPVQKGSGMALEGLPENLRRC